jgi:hypothetical protein
VVSTGIGNGGRWRAGIIWADPSAPCRTYRQEYYQGEAEDWGKVISSITSLGPSGSFTGCIKTEDWNALSSGREHKYYCSSIGLVLEIGKRGNGTRTELESFSTP